MASAIGIAAASNLHDGVSAQVTLSGLPVGTLGIWASEVPTGPEFACAYAPLGGSLYSVTLPYSDIWYLWAKDDNGFGAQLAAVYTGVSDDQDTDKIGNFLRSTLEANAMGINAVMQSWYPNTTVKQFHYGIAANVLLYPSIIVTNPRATWDWFTLPFGQQWNYSFTIACVAQKSEEETETPLATRMMEAVFKILSRRRYLDQTLGDLPLFYCMVKEGQATEVQLESGFVTAASLVWSGRAIKQIKPGHPTQ